MLRAIVSTAFVVLVGCADAAAPEAALQTNALSAPRCFPHCGLAALPPTPPPPRCNDFVALSPQGVPGDGVTVLRVQRADGVALRLVADLDRLRGLDPVTGAALADHQGLTGTQITVSIAGSIQRLTIDRVDPAGAQLRVGAGGAVETYELSSSQADDPLLSGRAIVFGRDHYDPVTKQVSLDPATYDRITFACDFTAAFQMHVLGHTSAAATRLGIPITLDQRQAMLNALVMNACGTGRSFAAPGQPFTVTETLPVTLASTEAIWDAHGLVCLDVPRAASTADADQIRAQITAECGAPPPCSSMIASWPSYGEVVTGK
jgi:hypothetical protein